MLDRLVLHIGAHKTGTTAIQGSLVDAYDSLLARGILYPRAGRLGTGHDQLARELYVDVSPPVTETMSHLELLEEVRAVRPSAVVVSAEDLSAPNPRERAIAWASHLGEELQPREMRVVAYVRPQWEYIASSYAQRVKQGATRLPFEQHLEWAFGEGSARFDYCQRFDAWREAFGDRLEIRLYAPELLRGGDVVSDFWRAVGLGSPPEADNEYSNRRLGAVTTEMLRALHEFLSEHQLDEVVPVGLILGRARRLLNVQFPDDPPFSPLTPALVARIAERFAASNDAFVREYLGVRETSFFTPAEGLEIEPTTWSLSEASERERVVFEEIVRHAVRQARAGARPVASGEHSGRGSRDRLRRMVGRLRWRLRVRLWLR